MPGSDKSKETPEDLAPGERLPVDPDFGPKDAQLPFEDGPDEPAPHLEEAAPLRDSRPLTEPMPPGGPSQLDDTMFLAEAFDIAEPAAADLVAEGEASSGLAAEATRQRAARDDLADVPTPDEPEQELVADQDEVRLKPVLHSRQDGPGGD